jgi:hypothetical protein
MPQSADRQFNDSISRVISSMQNSRLKKVQQAMPNDGSWKARIIEHASALFWAA